MRKSARSLVILVFTLACVTAVLADRPVDETVAAEPGGTVSVELIAGSVDFIGWDRNEVQITGTLEEDVKGLEVESGGKHVSIEVKIRSGRNVNRASADLKVHVPFGSRIEAEAVSAELTVDSVGGDVSVECVNGNVSIEGDLDEVSVSVVSGNITVESNTAVKGGRFETVSGNIDFRGDLDPGGRFNFESLSGNVILYLPLSISAEFNVETFSGDIDNELGPAAVRSGEYVPSKSLEFTLGSGSARVSVESFSGNVRLLQD
jgi:DUF4097 and DUF4098 domain-containing protein YvlB